MEIKAVKFREKGFMTQPFALGGEDGVDKFDPNVKPFLPAELSD